MRLDSWRALETLVFDFTISGADMDVLDGFNENLITGWDPTDVLY